MIEEDHVRKLHEDYDCNVNGHIRVCDEPECCEAVGDRCMACGEPLGTETAGDDRFSDGYFVPVIE